MTRGNSPLWTWKHRCKLMVFISRNGFLVEDKGSHSAKVQVLPVPLFRLFHPALPKCLSSAAPWQLAWQVMWEAEVWPLWISLNKWRDSNSACFLHFLAGTYLALQVFLFVQQSSSHAWSDPQEGRVKRREPGGPVLLRKPATDFTAKVLAHKLAVVLGNEAPRLI